MSGIYRLNAYVAAAGKTVCTGNLYSRERGHVRHQARTRSSPQTPKYQKYWYVLTLRLNPAALPYTGCQATGELLHRYLKLAFHQLHHKVKPSPLKLKF